MIKSLFLLALLRVLRARARQARGRAHVRTRVYAREAFAVITLSMVSKSMGIKGFGLLRVR